jgi:hypothetical protein
MFKRCGFAACRYPQLPLYVCAGLKVLIHRNRIAAGEFRACFCCLLCAQPGCSAWFCCVVHARQGTTLATLALILGLTARQPQQEV